MQNRSRKERKVDPLKKEEKNAVLKRYGKAVGIGLASTVAAAAVMGLFGAESEKEAIRTLSNAFMVGSGILLCWWCILWAGKNGALDCVGYSMGALTACIKSIWKKDAPTRIGGETYADYVEQMQEKTKNRKCDHPLVVGLILLAASVGFAFLYMK